jgi:ADP-heptose:LPS heptosyltransferase
LIKEATPRECQEAGTRDIGAAAWTDFADAAATFSNLDLVIAVDTAAAHLGGALGIPVWIALPSAPDWRWGLERADSPWYPTARLFRQAARGDWDGVFKRIGEELARFHRQTRDLPKPRAE